MLRPFLFMQWKVSRWAVLALLPLCLGLPIMIVRFAARVAQRDPVVPAVYMVQMIELWLPLFPLLAGVTGAAFAITAWAWDHRTNHVYALSLPVPRWRYALLKAGAGAAVLMLPVFALLVGALIATWMTPIPEGLHAYPVSFAMRFLMATLLCYALVFALAAGTVKTTVRIFFGVFVVLVFGTLLTDLLHDTLGITWLPSPLDILSAALLEWPGPFNVFGGNWMLIDV